jgi:protein arginine kinase activator
MLCEMCKKSKATVRYTEVVDNKIVKMNLCEECAKKKGVSIQSPFTIADLLAGLADLGLREAEDGKKTCLGCGLSYKEFRKTGRLGCARCYEAFEKNLKGLLETIHKSTKHVGKVPTHLREKTDVLRKIRELEQQLSAVVEKEEFEQAAAIRDKIQAMKQAASAKDSKDSGE